MNSFSVIYKRELKSYFETPIAYVFAVVFLLLSGVFTFYLSNFYETGVATLDGFFSWHPWLYLFLVPAISMRLWSEERRLGSLELLMTLPVTTLEVVLGKYLAAWSFLSIALLLTFPIWITVNYLGDPDNGVIIAGYIASLIMAGGYLAIGACISSLTRNQVVAFVISAVVCFLFTISGFSMVLNFFSSLGFSQIMIDTINSLSILTNFLDMTKGVLEVKSLLFFFSLIVFWLAINIVVVNHNRA
jgi:ABC-2 type transport system permease protein